VLRQGVQGISDIITIPGIINRDFADVKTTMAGMGHAVMGTAVRAGQNRAVEAAQAAMASPLLEAGAIDGARGILINITGSSSLKLSEVYEASSLIQSAAHEDANIIFGAVLDEKMGEEVKITVIATGFRDQMPERRARMLSVEETPVVSVPVVAPDNWLRETDPAPEPAPAPARFMGQDEDAAADEAFFYSSAIPPVATTVTVAGVSAKPDAGSQFRTGPQHEAAIAPASAHFDEMELEADSMPSERRYAADSEGGVRGPSEEPGAPPSQSLYPEGNDEAQRDLDVPAFLRRLQF
jgi:cell division protein FtsZ